MRQRPRRDREKSLRDAFQKAAKDYATASANFADDPNSFKYESALDLAWMNLESTASAYVRLSEDLIPASPF